MGGLNSPNPYSDGMNGGGDFWSQLSATNAELDALQEKIRSVSQAHQQILVSAKWWPFLAAMPSTHPGARRARPVLPIAACYRAGRRDADR